MLFFAGASFTAGAGDQTARLLDEDAAALAGETATGTEPTTTAAEPHRPKPPRSRPFRPKPSAERRSGRPSPRRSRPSRSSPSPLRRPQLLRPRPSRPCVADNVSDATDAAIVEQTTPTEQAASSLVAPAPAKPSAKPETAAADAAAAKPATPPTPTKKWVVKRAAVTAGRGARDRARQDHGEPTIWLNRALPDPTPASARLARPFARQLAADVEASRRRLGRRARSAPGAGRAWLGACNGSRARHARVAARRHRTRGRVHSRSPAGRRSPTARRHSPISTGRSGSRRS